MPSRKVPLTTGEYYHIYNRSQFSLPIFSKDGDAKAFLKTLIYYTQVNPPRRLSYEKRYKEIFTKSKTYADRLVSILAYCIMPNHFHLLLRQEVDGGISTYMQRLTLSFVHYFNVKNHQKGHLFESGFKSVLIETENQLLHVSRYIHLNPTSAKLVEDPLKYKYSSLQYYVHGGEKLPLLFDNVLRSKSRDYYRNFVYNNLEYQQSLQFIKNQLIDHEI